MAVWRPSDSIETLLAWKIAPEHESMPMCPTLSRRTLAFQQREAAALADIHGGAYILVRGAAAVPDVVLTLPTSSSLRQAPESNWRWQRTHGRLNKASPPASSPCRRPQASIDKTTTGRRTSCRPSCREWQMPPVGSARGPARDLCIRARMAAATCYVYPRPADARPAPPGSATGSRHDCHYNTRASAKLPCHCGERMP